VIGEGVGARKFSVEDTSSHPDRAVHLQKQLLHIKSVRVMSHISLSVEVENLLSHLTGSTGVDGTANIVGTALAYTCLPKLRVADVSQSFKGERGNAASVHQSDPLLRGRCLRELMLRGRVGRHFPFQHGRQHLTGKDCRQRGRTDTEGQLAGCP
jgi:hypothetical protein